MANRECPTCHGQTELAAKCPYCPHCGWNRDAAAKSVRRGMVLIPVALIGFVAPWAILYMTGTGHMRGPQVASVVIPLLCLPLLAYGIAYLYLRRKLDELNALPERR